MEGTPPAVRSRRVFLYFEAFDAGSDLQGLHQSHGGTAPLCEERGCRHKFSEPARARREKGKVSTRKLDRVASQQLIQVNPARKVGNKGVGCAIWVEV